jgi:hypothetical protein
MILRMTLNDTEEEDIIDDEDYKEKYERGQG